MENKEKVAGIIGGMGPEATVDLLQRVINLTPALDDKDHIRCIVDNDPKIPSRIKAIIEGQGEDPGPYLAKMAKQLESWSADFLAIPCNTAHFYYASRANAVDIPVLNLIQLVVNHVKKTDPSCKKIGMLGSTALIVTGLYETPFKEIGVEVIYPSSDDQDTLFNLIKNIKAENSLESIIPDYIEIGKNLSKEGVDSAIIGCTELSVIQCEMPFKQIDAADVLARAIVETAKNIK